MEAFFQQYQSELIKTLILIGVFFIVNLIFKIILKRIGKRSNINSARVSLIVRYVTVTLFLIAVLIESFF